MPATKAAMAPTAKKPQTSKNPLRRVFFIITLRLFRPMGGRVSF
jgi:hypothetical protein